VEEHIGRSVGELFPELAMGIESQLRHVIETGESILQGLVLAETPAQPGVERCFQHNYIAVKSDDGAIVGVSCAVIEITAQKRAEESLRKAHDELEIRVEQRTAELAVLSGRLIRAQEDERSHIARELHDDFNQRLALIAVELDTIEKTPPNLPEQISEQISERLQRVSRQVKDLSSDLHRLSYELHPSKIERLGLVSAVRSFCRDFSQQTGVTIDFRDSPFEDSPSPPVALSLYRVIQESLSNIKKHSGAHEAVVSLTSGSDGILLMVSDVGVGFDVASREDHPGIGLISMRERIRLIGGKFSITSSVGGGTSIEVRVPNSADSR